MRIRRGTEPVGPRIGEELSVEQWEPPLATEAEGGHWVAHLMVWDGAKYVRAVAKLEGGK